MSNQSNHPEQEKTEDQKIIESFNEGKDKDFLEKINNLFKTPVIVVQVAPTRSNVTSDKQDENKNEQE